MRHMKHLGAGGSSEDKGCIQAQERGHLMTSCEYCECTTLKPNLLRFPSQSCYFIWVHPVPTLNLHA